MTTPGQRGFWVGHIVDHLVTMIQTYWNTVRSEVVVIWGSDATFKPKVLPVAIASDNVRRGPYHGSMNMPLILCGWQGQRRIKRYVANAIDIEWDLYVDIVFRPTIDPDDIDELCSRYSYIMWEIFCRYSNFDSSGKWMNWSFHDLKNLNILRGSKNRIEKCMASYALSVTGRHLRRFSSPAP